MAIFNCAHCGSPFQRANHRVPAYGVFCKSTRECQRAFWAAKQNHYATLKKLQGIDVSAPHRQQAARNRQRRIASGNAVLFARPGVTTEERFTRNQVGDDHDWACLVCREPVAPDLKTPRRLSPAVCYVVPPEIGGRHVRANVRIVHLGCNISRSIRLTNIDHQPTLADFLF